MRYRQLGGSGLRVSVLAMGTMTFGGKEGWARVGSTDVEEARRQVDRCLDAGVNLIDTANVYSTGLSEEICGQVLEGRRHQVLIATKARMPMGDGPNDAGLSRHHLVRECEASLRRLRTDHIDLYQVHEWDGQTPLEETLQALDDLVRSGKVGYVGCSNYAGWQLMKAEYELVPIAVDQALGLLVWSPLAGGLLSGKYRRGKGPEESRQLSGWDEPPVRDEDWLYDIVDVLVEVAEGRGASPAQVALAWLLARPAVTSVIVGARTTEQLADNLGAADLTLTDEEQARLEQVSRPPLLYPYWHQARTATDRLGPPDLSLLGPHLAGPE
jgi:aryl-alcohol dehydrogenase-like predicted oxidoreductase